MITNVDDRTLVLIVRSLVHRERQSIAGCFVSCPDGPTANQRISSGDFSYLKAISPFLNCPYTAINDAFFLLCLHAQFTSFQIPIHTIPIFYRPIVFRTPESAEVFLAAFLFAFVFFLSSVQDPDQRRRERARLTAGSQQKGGKKVGARLAFLPSCEWHGGRGGGVVVSKRREADIIQQRDPPSLPPSPHSSFEWALH